MGVRDHFPICGNFHGNFLLEFYEGFFADGVLNHFPICGTRIHLHALVIDMAHAIGAGIPAPSDHFISFIINSYYTIIKYKIVVKKDKRIQCF